MNAHYRPRIFAYLFCEHEQNIYPHFAGRVIKQRDSGLDITVKCGKCRVETIHTMSQLPVGYRAYAIRITGEDGPHLPDAFRPVCFLEEEFVIAANSVQDAHERAGFATSLIFNGHLVTYYIDGEKHLDERF